MDDPARAVTRGETRAVNIANIAIFKVDVKEIILRNHKEQLVIVLARTNCWQQFELYHSLKFALFTVLR